MVKFENFAPNGDTLAACSACAHAISGYAPDVAGLEQYRDATVSGALALHGSLARRNLSAHVIDMSDSRLIAACDICDMPRYPGQWFEIFEARPVVAAEAECDHPSESRRMSDWGMIEHGPEAGRLSRAHWCHACGDEIEVEVIDDPYAEVAARAAAAITTVAAECGVTIPQVIRESRDSRVVNGIAYVPTTSPALASSVARFVLNVAEVEFIGLAKYGDTARYRKAGN